VTIDEVLAEGLRELGARRRVALIYRDERGVPRPEPLQHKLLAAYKAELKKLRRSVALECHPDRTESDDEEMRARKTRKFKAVSRAVDYLLKLKVHPVPRPVVVMQSPLWGMASSSSTTSTGWAPTVYIRFM